MFQAQIRKIASQNPGETGQFSSFSHIFSTCPSLTFSLIKNTVLELARIELSFTKFGYFILIVVNTGRI